MMAYLWQREFGLKWRSPSGSLYALVFFVMVLVLFPFAVGAEPKLLARLGSAAVWIAALLAVLLGADSLFQRDVEDGTVEQLVVGQGSLALWALIKVCVHWLGSGLLVSLVSLLVVPLFGLDWPSAGILMLTLVIGTPILTLFTAIAAALTVTLRGNGVLVPLLAIPLQLPVLIFGSGTVNLWLVHSPVMPVFALLLGLLLLSIVTIPWVLAAALRLAVSQ